MKITLEQIKIADIANGYIDNNEEGVYGFGGKLNIRPKYQREFVYKDKQRDKVIDTIMRGLPLNVMYWAKNEDDTFEVLDGQQRTISICQYVNGDFSINDMYFHNLTNEDKEKILNYEIMVYVCEGSDKERLEWFERINIAGEPLTRQELLNINYTGTWLSSAKSKFSKTGCVAVKKGDKYIKGSAIRQEILELVLTWICGDKKDIAKYMSEHQHDINANELWLYFCSVIDWVETTFPNYRKEMKGIDWGRLYTEFSGNAYDVKELESEISRLMADEEVTNKKGVYEYVLSYGMREKALSVRTFSDKDKRTKYEQQNGICPICNNHFEIEQMQGDHIVEWVNGGKTTLDNLQMVCHKCHKDLTNTMRD
jgi:hypothetical protein